MWVSLKTLALSALLAVSAVEAAPKGESSLHPRTIQGKPVFGVCLWPLVRKEWRALSDTEKKDYISAVKCLQKKPAQLTHIIPGAQNRFEDYLGVHIIQTDNKHFTGDFQAFHRYLLSSYEADLRSLCGYKGAQPYWDWTIDVASPGGILASPIWDPVTGFGGNGCYEENPDPNPRLPTPDRTGGGCVTDGPFKDMVINLGPQQNIEKNPQCLRRDFVPSLMERTLSKKQVEWTMEAENFGEFDVRVQGGIELEKLTYHGGGHVGIGGEMGTIQDVYSSPGDPLFYLHHANMDRIYWEWQKKAPITRLFDVSGPVNKFGAPFDFFGPVEGGNVTLASDLEMIGLIKDAKIWEVMNPLAGKLCYTYK